MGDGDKATLKVGTAQKQKKVISIFNFTQCSTNNTQNEYKYHVVFVLQKTGLTGFLQTSHMAEHVS